MTFGLGLRVQFTILTEFSKCTILRGCAVSTICRPLLFASNPKILGWSSFLWGRFMAWGLGVQAELWDNQKQSFPQWPRFARIRRLVLEGTLYAVPVYTCYTWQRVCVWSLEVLVYIYLGKQTEGNVRTLNRLFQEHQCALVLCTCVSFAYHT